MIVAVMSHVGDEIMAGLVADLARRCDGAHDVRRYHRNYDGVIDALPGVTIRQRQWPGVCTETFKAVIASVPDGELVLNLEPDAVLTRPSALFEIERAVHRQRQRFPDAMVFGHWKTPPGTENAPVEHMSGCSVYRVCPELRDALGRVSNSASWDLCLFFRDYLQPGDGIDIPEIRCLWGVPIMPSRTLRDYASAALIHGDKSGGLLRRVRKMAFGLPE